MSINKTMHHMLGYYQKELHYLQEQGQDFALRYPKIAGRLGMIEGTTEDPHISRLIESFALLTARIHQRIDEDMPEMVDAMLSALAPQFLRPFPSVCIISLEPDALHSGLSNSNLIPADTALFTHPQDSTSCEFRSVYPVSLLPVTLTHAAVSFDSDKLSWQLAIRFQVWPGAHLKDNNIRIYLHGPVNVTDTLYTLLLSQISQLILCQEHQHIPLPADTFQAVGFEPQEALLSREPKISPVHILLLDYFCFSRKFSFVDLHLPPGFDVSGGSEFVIQATFKQHALTERLEKMTGIINSELFRLHCTPAINLFLQRAEPFTLNNTSTEYPINLEARSRNHTHVWAINKVNVQQENDRVINKYRVPSLLDRHQYTRNSSNKGLHWQSFQRNIAGYDNSRQHHTIAFSRQISQSATEQPEIITIDVLCTNGDIPCQLNYGNPGGDFNAEVAVAGLRIIALTQPSRPVPPLTHTDARWRFLSQLTLNHQLLDGIDGARQLRETLTLYNINHNVTSERLCNMILTVSCQPVTARLIRNDPLSLARGIDLTITFQQEALREPEYYLLSSVLDRMLGLYAPVNSFIRLITAIDQAPHSTQCWPIRAGRLSWI